MNSKMLLFSILVLGCLLGSVENAGAQGTAFTYQGRLAVGGAQANGFYDFGFAVFDAPANGVMQGPPVTLFAVVVTNGLFAVALDLGPVFNGDPRWLEISATTNGGSTAFTLSPRQPLTPAPYAIYASGSLVAASATTIAPGQAVTSLNQLTDAVALAPGTNIDIATAGNQIIISSPVPPFVPCCAFQWHLVGNAGTIAGPDFVGTTDLQPLEMHVNNTRSLRLEPGIAGVGAPNVIGGSPANRVDPGIMAGTISGGGATNFGGVPYTNRVGAHFGSIGGGGGNTTLATAAAIGGGLYNSILSAAATEATIAGGYSNSILGGAYSSQIAGGQYNLIVGAYTSVIDGGNQNVISNIIESSIIGGGDNNTIQDNNDEATIAGGENNTIAFNGGHLTISGGFNNLIQHDVDEAVIAGGSSHTIGTGAPWATISGGSHNTIATASTSATIAGGMENTIADACQYSTISGGLFNFIVTNAEFATIGGGTSNVISASSAFLIGSNLVTLAYATISGGCSNTIATNGTYSTIPGGCLNVAAGLSTFAAGFNANATNDGAFVWADTNNCPFYSIAPCEFAVRATGGARFVSAINGLCTPIAGVVLASGGGSWTSLSDRQAKENFEQVDARKVLDKVVMLPVTTWNYKSQPASIRHIGPTAQDFKAAFAVGETDTGITTVDEGGVALAAIQGLNQRIEEKEATIRKQASLLQEQTGQIALLKQRLEALEQLMNTKLPSRPTPR